MCVSKETSKTKAVIVVLKSADFAKYDFLNQDASLGLTLMFINTVDYVVLALLLLT